MSKFAVIDFETSGLSPNKGDRAIEVGIVIVENGKITQKFDSLINPGFKISSEITRITTITNEMLSEAPKANEVFPKVHDFIRGAVLVAHNASFDNKFFEHEMELLNLKVEHSFLCTLLLSRRLYQWAPNHKLITLIEALNIGEEGIFHRALSDAWMTAKLFNRICTDLNNLYEKSTEFHFLQKYQKTPKSKLKSIPKTIKESSPRVKESINTRNTLRSQSPIEAALATRDMLRAKKRLLEENENSLTRDAKIVDIYDGERTSKIRKVRKTEVEKFNKKYSHEISRLESVVRNKEIKKKAEIEKAYQSKAVKKTQLKGCTLKASIFPEGGDLVKNIPFYFILLPIVFALLVGGVFIVGFSGTLSVYSTLLLAWCITNWLLSMEYKGDIEYEESDELRKALEMINTKYKVIEKQVHNLESLKEYKSYLEELIHTDPIPFESYIKNK
jgi:DNA polymerase-3 subunit epsilon